MFYTNIVIKGNRRIVNWDFREKDSIKKILDEFKFKFSDGTVRLNDEPVDDADLDKPIIQLKPFIRWHKNTITFADPPVEKKEAV